MKISAIRCPEERVHSTTSGNTYPTCGHLLMGYDEKYLYLRCPICKIFWKITIDDMQHVGMSQVPKNEQLQLESVLRIIDDDR